MSIKILFFGKLAEAAQTATGNSYLEYPYSPSLNNIDAIRSSITNTYPTLKNELQKPANLCAVNQNICQQNTSIQDGDEITFMSPFSGG